MGHDSFPFFVIVGEVNGERVYWQNWTGTSIKGRPKWIDHFTQQCLFANEETAERTRRGEGSGHWRTIMASAGDVASGNWDRGLQVKNIRIKEVTILVRL